MTGSAKLVSFQLVLSQLVEPDLQLIVSAGSGRSEHFHPCIQIDHDPQIRADCLTEELNDQEREFYRRLELERPTFKLRRSAERTTAATIIIVPQFEGTAFKIFLPDSGSGFAAALTSLNRHGGEAVAGLEYEVLYQALVAIVQLPNLHWDARAEGGDRAATVELYLERSLYRELHRKTARAFDYNTEFSVLLSEAFVQSS